MKFLDKWMELENIILSEITESQKISHGMYSLISGYYPRNFEYTRHILNDVQEERRSGPCFWKDSVQQYRGIPEQECGKEEMGEQGERRGLMGLLGNGEPQKGKSFAMLMKNISN